MYEAFYGLSSKPFQLNPDPHFYFGSKQHRRAKAYLDYGVSRNDGFIVITGEIGAGKTTVLRNLLDGLVQTNIVTGHLVTTQLSAEDTLQMVGAAFGFRVQGVRKAELLSALEAFLLTQTSHGKRCLLVVDEAQNLTMSAVEELRMLSNFQLGNQALLQTFLIGQPEFREILQRPQMEPLRQRVAATCHIGPLDLAETEAYIGHRLKCAGSTGAPTFEPDAFAAIHRASQGIPRRINSICDRVLLLGYMENRKILTLADVNEVVSEFAREAEVSSETPSVQRRAINGAAEACDIASTSLSLEVDHRQLNLAPQVAKGISRRLGELDASYRDERLLRLEESLLRLEQIHLQTLGTLQEFVRSVTKSRDEGGS